MSPFVFAGAKRRSGVISKFLFLIPANWGVATFSLQKVPESSGNSGVFPYLFCCAKPGLWIKQNLEAQPYPENELLTTKKSGITMEVYGKNN